LRRTATMLHRRAQLPPDEATNVTRFHLAYERALVSSIERFASIPRDVSAEAAGHFERLETLVGTPPPPAPAAGDGQLVFARNPEVKGPMTVFGYDYLADHYEAERRGNLRLLSYRGLRGSGSSYAYEVLNFVDGRRNAQEIRDSVSAAYGPIPLDVVVEYLRALESIGILQLL
jgi:hypothetical protein